MVVVLDLTKPILHKEVLLHVFDVLLEADGLIDVVISCSHFLRGVVAGSQSLMRHGTIGTAHFILGDGGLEWLLRRLG